MQLKMHVKEQTNQNKQYHIRMYSDTCMFSISNDRKPNNRAYPPGRLLPGRTTVTEKCLQQSINTTVIVIIIVITQVGRHVC